ncbi:MAG: hypothetical protein Q9161_000946 [Pseudevernia consocians]
MPPRPPLSSLSAIQPLKVLSRPFTSPILRTLPHRPLFPKPSLRPASQWGPRRSQYNRFENAQNMYTIWRASPNFRYGVGVVGLGAGGLYFYNLEQVPISGRRRFNCISPAMEEAMAESQYEKVLQAYGREVLPPNHPHSRMVIKVLERLIPAAGLEGQKWKVQVIDDPEQKNAFVLPGGKVFVFSGILPICAGEDGLAAVLGHEIAHNIAHHTAEKVSQIAYLYLATVVLKWFFDIPDQFSHFLLDIAFERPGSRKMESEADYIGLLMMAQACYNPNAAVGLWERMAKAEQYAPPQFLSTHPASKNRMTVIQEWLPQAQQKRAEGECESTFEYVDDFRRAFGHGDDRIW